MTRPFASASQRSGFSLIELSIVLVILGLLTGGILSGQSLIRAAELRSITEEYSRYVASVRTYRDKYFSIPGDMSNATSFWGTSGTCPGQTATAESATCNGDGDGRLETNSASANENFRFWQHLANAGLVEGAFTGTTDSAGGSATVLWSVVGVNVPRSRISQAGWTPIYVGTVALDGDDQDGTATTLFEGTYDHVFAYGLVATTNASVHSTTGALLKPEEAWNIDTKLDDGKPGTGLLRTYESQGNATTGCSNTAASTTAAVGSTSAYLLSNSNQTCSLVFKIGI